MFQLYKARNFSAYFKDTFDFLRLHGKHFFRNYIIVNGVFLLILIAMSIIFIQVYSDIFVQDFVLNRNPEALTNYLNEHSASIITYAIIFIIVGLIVGILNYAFIPIYFKLYQKHSGANFMVNEIVTELKANIGKLFKYILAAIVVSIPAIIVAGIISLILSITIIGIPFILFVVALITLFYHSALMEYILSDNKKVFDCFSYSLNLCFQKFFPAIGTVAVFMLMSIIFQSIFGMIEFVISMILGVTSLEEPTNIYDLDRWSFTFIFIFTIQIISYLVNYLVSAVLQINQAIIYFGLKEERENINTQSTIDQIGSDD